MNGEDETIEEGDQPSPEDVSTATASQARGSGRAPRQNHRGPTLGQNGEDEIEEGDFEPEPAPSEEDANMRKHLGNV